MSNTENASKRKVLRLIKQFQRTCKLSENIAATEPNRKLLESAVNFAMRDYSFTRVWIILNKTTGALRYAKFLNLEGTAWKLEPAEGNEVFLDIFEPIGPTAYESPEALLRAILGEQNYARIFTVQN